MAVNQSAFFRGERTLLFQDSVRNTYFADVMKQGRDFDLIHMFFRNIQFSSDSDRPLRQSRAMYPGTDVLEIESWLNAQISELRNARCCSSSSLMRSTRGPVCGESGSPTPAIVIVALAPRLAISGMTARPGRCPVDRTPVADQRWSGHVPAQRQL